MQHDLFGADVPACRDFPADVDRRSPGWRFFSVSFPRPGKSGSFSAGQVALIFNDSDLRGGGVFEGVQMHGGIGMTDEHEAGFYIKRARVAEMTLWRRGLAPCALGAAAGLLERYENRYSKRGEGMHQGVSR